MKRLSIIVPVSLAFLMLFGTFLNVYLSTNVWDYDFWWHIATGKYIWENKATPDSDPFSFVSGLEENKDPFPERTRLILKQYWLAQVLFYKVYEAFGDAGMIVLRSSILFFLLLLVFWWMRREKVHFIIMYGFVFLSFSSTLVFTGERPVLFTLLFSVITFCVLEEFRRKKRGFFIFGLVPLFLLWANLHGGYILGAIIVLVYIAGESFNYLLVVEERDRRYLSILCGVGVLAIACTGINPSGYAALEVFKFAKYKSFTDNIQEYMPVYKLYLTKVRKIDWDFVIVAAMFPVVAALRRRKMAIVHYLLVGGLLFQALSALRFTIYYVLISAPILGRELSSALAPFFERVQVSARPRIETAGAMVLVCSSVLFASGYLDFGNIKFQKAIRHTVPQGAVDFIQSKGIRGNLYNDMGYGGYLIWRLYPGHKIFIDTRNLNRIVISEYGWIHESIDSLYSKELPPGRTPLWERLLDHYKIDTVVLDTMDMHGGIPPLVLALMKHPAWVPVYADLTSVIFLRSTDGNEKLVREYRLPGSQVYDSMIVRLTQWAAINDYNPKYLLSLGDVFSSQGRVEDAKRAYNYALVRSRTKEVERYVKGRIEKLSASNQTPKEKGEEKL